MPAWAPFLGFVVVLAVAAVGLARESARYVRAGLVPAPPALYANVVVTQALVVGLLGVAAWWAAVPVRAVGGTVSGAAVLAGLVTGGGLAGASAVGTLAFSRFGVAPAAALRDALAPRSRGEAVALYLVALPAVAIGEELLFRWALVGTVIAALDVSPWLPVLGSSALFGYAHSAQGRVGVVLTGVLGVVLAWVFLATDSLLAVVVAHYVVNAVEFAVGARLTEG